MGSGLATGMGSSLGSSSSSKARSAGASMAVGTAASGSSTAAGSPISKKSPQHLLVDDSESPIPLSRCAQERCSYTTLEDIFGPEGSTARYIKRQVIGKGAFGEAYIVERNSLYVPNDHKGNEVQYASNNLANLTIPKGLYVAKVMDLRGMAQQDRCYTQTEIMCLAHTHHFAIIKYYEHYILDSEDETMVIVTEFADHGDLNRNLNRGCIRDRFAKNALSCLQLTEREVGTYFVQLLMAFHHIHSRRMIHRDVKSANLFLTSRGFIKLGDFGFSQKYESTVSSETIAGTFLGTPYYLSPEMWKGTRYGKKADVWAAGVVLYEMLMDGQRPFDGCSLPELREVVVGKDVELPAMPPPSERRERAEPFSSEMRDFVKLILQKDPNLRPSAEELLHTPIMQHYLRLFEKHVHSLINEDDAKLAADPNTERYSLHFADPDDKALALQGIADAKSAVAKAIEKDISQSAAPRYEGVIYKDSRNGVWKERYLILADNVLTITLAQGKEAAGGGERSKKVPLNMIKSVSPCEVESAHVRTLCAEGGGAPGAADSFKPPYAFAVAMQSTNSIVFGVADAQELDKWMSTLMRALNID